MTFLDRSRDLSYDDCNINANCGVTVLTKESLCEAIINKLVEGIYFVNKDRAVLLWNESAEKITGYSAVEVQNGGKSASFLDPIDKDGNRMSLSGLLVDRALEKGETCEQELFIKHKKGYRVSVLAQTVPLWEDGEIAGAIETFSDRLPHTEKNEMMDALTRLVMIDQLTGLSNRRHTESVLELKLKEFKRFNKLFCVLKVTLDNFEDCCNTYGLEYGNDVLVRMSESLRRSVRRADFIGRWQDNEFLGIFEIKEPGSVGRIAEKLSAIVGGVQAADDEDAARLTVLVGGTAVHSDDTLHSLLQRVGELARKCGQCGEIRAGIY